MKKHDFYWKERFSKIKRVITKRPYNYLFLIFILIYITANIFLNELYVTFPVLFTYNLKIIIPFLIASVIIAILVAINLNLIILKFRELKQIRKEGGISFLGIFGGILGGACPSCFAGLFPAFLGLFGITASLSSLPFLGFELQVASVLLLTLSAIFMTNRNTCKIKKP